MNERALKKEIPVYECVPRNFDSKQQYEEQIIRHLREAEIDFIVLAGYMRLVGPTLLKAFEGKIVNIHPSLLPSFPGTWINRLLELWES